VPFINPTTSVADPAQFQGWDSLLGVSRTINSGDITNIGFPGRIEKRNGMTMIRYNAGDGITAGKCRTQLNSYQLPPRTHVRWELAVAFGADDVENSWVLTPPMESRVLFWQVKSTVPGNPSLQATVDTDPADPANSLVLRFFRKGGHDTEFQTIGKVHGVKRNSIIPIQIEAFLDERDINTDGKGRVRVWVQGQMIGDAVGPTLTWGNGVHNWAMAMYLFDEPKSYRHSRASFWEVARMFVYPKL
jgi:hypothetical protein